jgi:hypothetical protein
VSPETWLFAPAPPVDRRLGQAAVDDHAGGQAGAEVGGAEADQLTVGIDVVALLRGVGLRRGEALGEPDENYPNGCSRETEVVAERSPARKTDAREARLDGADDIDATIDQTEGRDGSDAQQDSHERAGNERQPSFEPKNDRETQDAGDERRSVCVAQVPQQRSDLFEEVALTLRHPEQPRQLSRNDREGESDDETLEHRLGDERRQEAEPGQPGDARGSR